MNEPAFPTSHEEPADFNGHNGSKKIVIDQGMTLRDYFAAKAMQSMLSAYPCQAIDDGDGGIQASWFDLASDSYDMADAMLEARK